ncbi:MAG TPA: 1-acyl-sn-glycerol-3-phosphate acyltransferase [Anaeromyxobacteraceae bacterium]|nr:1-acyl-sn-glycerol-3-phosphate acyltransferase [Anaeromyxobacteraceae bacterium]
MAGTGARQTRRTAPRKRPPRPALGNDPFERGAAPRSPLPAPPPAPREARLDRLEAKVEEAFADAEARLEQVLGRGGAGRYAGELRQALVRLWPALLERLRPIASLAGALASPGPLDPWGMDGRLAERAAPVLDFLYQSWWRVEAGRLAELPPGPALVVANRGGALPWDALALRLAFRRAGRDLRPLLDDAALALPLFGAAAQRLGAVRATPEAAGQLLAAGASLGVFPEGTRAGQKPWSERYRLQRFGRGGFVKVALRAGVPIVPCAIVGGEEATPPAARSGWLGEFLGLPFLSMAPGLPLGPLGLLPLPSRWSIRCGEPLETRGLGPEKAGDQAAVAALAESTRAAVQRLLDEAVAARKSVFL